MYAYMCIYIYIYIYIYAYMCVHIYIYIYARRSPLFAAAAPTSHTFSDCALLSADPLHQRQSACEQVGKGHMRSALMFLIEGPFGYSLEPTFRERERTHPNENYNYIYIYIYVYIYMLSLSLSHSLSLYI